MSALDLVDSLIVDLESKLGIAPGETLPEKKSDSSGNKKKEKKEKKKDKKEQKKKEKENKKTDNADLPDICKLEFKVGKISKVWVHPEADKLYCEEIECGEDEPRQIASGLRKHYTEEQMLGQRLLVVSNLKVSFLLLSVTLFHLLQHVAYFS